MQTIAMANHKGGVAKTTTTRALGGILSETHRVLMIDMDPQGSLTGACGIQDASDASMVHVLGGSQAGTMALGDVLFEISETCYLAPADIALSRIELGLVSRMGRERVLAKALLPLAPHFDICLIDTAPSLGLLTVNALVAADNVIVPTLAEILSLRGLRLFLDTLDEVREELNPRLNLMGVLVTMFDGRTIHHQDGAKAIDAAGYPMFQTRIGRSIRVSESAIVGQAITEYDPHNPQATAYRMLAQEVIECLNVRA